MQQATAPTCISALQRQLESSNMSCSMAVKNRLTADRRAVITTSRVVSGVTKGLPSRSPPIQEPNLIGSNPAVSLIYQRSHSQRTRPGYNVLRGKGVDDSTNSLGMCNQKVGPGVKARAMCRVERPAHIYLKRS